MSNWKSGLERNRKILVLGIGAFTIGLATWSLINHVIPVKPPPARMVVGALLTGSRSEAGWNGAHYAGLVRAAKRTGVHLVYRENVLEKEPDVRAATHALIDSGATVIFATSYGYGQLLAAEIKEHPDVHFYCLSDAPMQANVATYFGWMYQARYLMGVVAGLRTRTNVIGYVAAMKNSEVVRIIDAFSLGARRVNPQVKILVYWVNSWNDPAEEKRGAEMLVRVKHADILAYHQNTSEVSQVARDLGVWSIGYHYDMQKQYGRSYLTASVWNWEPFYYERIRECRNHRFESRRYWESLEKGVVKISPYSPEVTPSIIARVEEVKRDLLEERYDVFYGPITDNAGKLRVRRGENISDEVLLSQMDWFVDGVTEVNASK